MRWQLSFLVLLAMVSIVVLLGVLSWPLASSFAVLIIPFLVGYVRRILPALPILAVALTVMSSVSFMIWAAVAVPRCPPECYEDALSPRQWVVALGVLATVALAAIGVGAVTEAAIRGTIQRDREWRLSHRPQPPSGTDPTSSTRRT